MGTKSEKSVFFTLTLQAPVVDEQVTSNRDESDIDTLVI